jgi:hypothetical protein
MSALALAALLFMWPPAADRPARPDASALPPEKANPVRIARLETPPAIDGRLDDPAWASATILKDFYQTNPGDNIAPSRPTEVLIGYDATTLYIAFRAWDEPGSVRATVPKRDQIWEDDYVGMFLDTFNDRRKAYALFFSPVGVQADGIFTADGNEDYSVDLVMESKGVVGKDGYTVEVAIPFKSLRYEAGEGKLWGAHFFRRIQRFDRELDSWMPNSRDRSDFLAQAGRLTGIEGVRVERTLELIPSLTLSQTSRRVAAPLPVDASALSDRGRLLNEPGAFDPGLTVKLGLTPTVTADFTVNPDFAQVEADQTVVTANRRFPIFFEEKRPFFLEGIEIFQSRLSTVNTRAIVDPDFAAKLTGKLGRTTFGVLAASDAAPGNFTEEERDDPELRDDVERLAGRNATIGVLRLKRDVGSESSLGLFATSYDFVDLHNRVAGVDGRFRLDPKTTFVFEAVGSTSRRPFYNPDLDESPYRTGNGFSYYFELDYTGRNFGYQLNGTGRTSDYRADVGFTQRTNFNFENFFVRVSSDPKPKAFLVSWRLVNFIGAGFDWQGRSREWNNGTRFQLNFTRQTFVSLGTDFGYERLFEEEFGPRRSAARAGAFAGAPERSTYNRAFSVVVETNPSEKFSAFAFMGTIRDAFDLDFGGGPRYPRVSPAGLVDPDGPLDPGVGHTFDVDANVTYKPTAALRASLGYTKARLTRSDTGLVAFDDNIFSLRATYQFTRFTFARARVDYDTLASSVRGQFLVGWAPNPGTALYAGYNDDLSYNGFSPFTDVLEPGFRRNNRTFFVKLSYLFRYGI